MKNNWFNKEAKDYKAARPGYPKALFEFLSTQTNGHQLAVDCGAGNGQATAALARYYDRVIGVDIGRDMLAHASPAPNIDYLHSSVSHLPFLMDSSVDLVTAAAAVHWFDLDEFYPEVDRVLKPGGTLALWAYYMPKVKPEIDSIVKDFFENTLGHHVNERRKWIINKYDNLPFPYTPKEQKSFDYSIEGDFNRFCAVLETSSFVQREIETTGHNPFDDIRESLRQHWSNPQDQKTLTWTHSMVLGRKP